MFKKIIIILLFFIIFCFQVKAENENKYFVFTVNKTKTNIINIDAQVIGGELKIAKNKYQVGKYQLVVYSFENEELKKVNFNFDLNVAEIRMTYFDKAEKVKIFFNNQEIYMENIAYLANVCGDNICQTHESREICKNDCPSGAQDDYCDMEKDKICDVDCIDKTMDVDCQKNFLINKKLFFIFLFLIISICFIYWGVKIIKNK